MIKYPIYAALTAHAVERVSRLKTGPGRLCPFFVQGKIAWHYRGKKGFLLVLVMFLEQAKRYARGVPKHYRRMARL